jgi:hypothetical protein
VHLICPSLSFAERAKTTLNTPPWMAQLLTRALSGAAKRPHKEGEARDKQEAQAQATRARQRHQQRTAQAKEESQAERQEKEVLCDAVFAVMQAAWEHATGGGQFRVSKRNLFYAVRDLVLDQHPTLTIESDKFVKYFTHKLLPRYQDLYGVLPGVYAESRGVLHEPHSGRTITLGTLAVEHYTFPVWLYNKILYIEKRTVWPTLEDARLAERYDMAILTGEGYATEAMRMLFKSASRDKAYQLFVLHDADPDGYNIAVTMREESSRMRGYSVEVIDLGLSMTDAQAMGMRLEPFHRKKALQQRLVLDEAARVAFTGIPDGRDANQKRRWRCHRVELNALSAPQLIAYIERQLAANGALGKVIPPAESLAAEARDARDDALDTVADRAMSALLDREAIRDRAVEHFRDRIPLEDAQAWIDDDLAAHPTHPWRTGLTQTLDSRAQDLWEEIETFVRHELLVAIHDVPDEE